MGGGSVIAFEVVSKHNIYMYMCNTALFLQE